MIRITRGNLLSAEVEAIVNTVNCVGVMGRGIALQFKKFYPENFAAYAKACKNGSVKPGHMFTVETGSHTGPKYIINFPTKRHWKGKSRMEDIQSGLVALRREIMEKQIQSIAIPPLGCGNGGLEWSRVRPMIESALEGLSHAEIVLYEPHDENTAESPTASSQRPQMTPGRSALLCLSDSYLRGTLDPFITLLELHKLMYFLQEAGQPLRLRFTKAPYGPYAENLRHVLSAIEGHFLVGYLDGGEQPGKPLELFPDAVEEAKSLVRTDQELEGRISRVTKLVSGFESPFGLELLATVHYVSQSEGVSSHEDLVEKVHQWNARKRQFSSRQIALAHAALAINGFDQNRT